MVLELHLGAFFLLLRLLRRLLLWKLAPKKKNSYLGYLGALGYLGYLGAFCYRLLLQWQTRASFAMATTSILLFKGHQIEDLLIKGHQIDTAAQKAQP